MAESLNFGRAAAQLRIAQPSLSHQIRQLEAELHAKLLARTTRRVELTEAGRLFLEEAREILAHADRAAVVARRASQSGLGTLRIGCAYWMDARRIVSSMEAFRARQPHIHFDLQTSSLPLQLAALLDGRLDAGFVRPPVGERPLASGLLLSEPFVAALPSDHRLTRRGRFSLSALAAEPFILPPRAAVPIFHTISCSGPVAMPGSSQLSRMGSTSRGASSGSWRPGLASRWCPPRLATLGRRGSCSGRSLRPLRS